METNFFGEYDAQHGADLDPQPTQQSPVISFNLDKPMGMDDYSKLPEYAQKEYLTKLKRSYGAGAAQIGQMFGITTEDACELMRECGVSAKGKRAANADELWAAFLGDYKLPELAPRFTLSEEEPPSETTEGAPEGDPQPEPEPEPRPAPPKPPEVSTVLRAFRVDLSGPIDAVMRRMSVFAAIVGNRNVTVTLSCDEDAEL
jgi:hypothetical protein